MKGCPRCGLINPDDALNCGGCRQTLVPLNAKRLSSFAEVLPLMSDDVLLRTVALDAAKYPDQEIELAREELRRRDLPMLTAEEYADHYKATLPKAPPGEFCPKCVAETIPAFDGDTFTVNFLFGTRLTGWDDPCPSCHSAIQEKWSYFIVPISRLGRYRVIWVGRRFFSNLYRARKLL